MPPKKKQYNGFYMFMKDFKAREESKGRVFRNMDEASTAAGAVWMNMGPEERGPFDSKAKELKNRAKGVKYTSTGVKVEVYEQRELEIQNRRRAMERYIENLVSDGKDYITKDFLVAYVNYYCFNNSNNSYIPAEISIVHFNLQDGVDLTDKFHVILCPVIPIGYRHAAENHAEESHGLPIPPHENATAELSETDFYAVLQNIIDYVSRFADGKPPPLYVLDNNMEQARSGFQHLLHAAGYDEDYFTVYSLSYLFYILRNAALATKISGDPVVQPVTADLSSVDGNSTTQAISIHVLQKEMERDIYSYTMDIACEYHNGGDQFCFCSLSFAIRNVFTICDHTCGDLGIEFIAGRHVPANAILDAKPSPRSKHAQPGASTSRNRCPSGRSQVSGVSRRSSGAPAESVASVVENKWQPVRLPTTPSIAGSFHLDFPALGKPSASARGRGRGAHRSAEESTARTSSAEGPTTGANRIIRRDASNPWNTGANDSGAENVSTSDTAPAKAAKNTGAIPKEGAQNPPRGASNGFHRGRGRGRIIRDD